MTDRVKEVLITCQKLLWALLVAHEKEEVDLAEYKQHVDFAEREVSDVLGEDE